MWRRPYLAMALLVLVAVAALWAAMVAFQAGGDGKTGLLKTFSSKDEIVGFISAKLSVAERDPLRKRLIETFRATASVLSEAAPRTPEYSATNIQVEGVDEADIVKTDGRIIYAASSRGLISIVKAYPPEEMSLLSRISVNGSVIGLFIYGDKLVVLVEEPIEMVLRPEGEKSDSVYLPRYFIWRISVKIYDVSAPEKPALFGEAAFEGTYISSRMIGNYAYIVLTYPILPENLALLPRWAVDGEWKEIHPFDIYYADSIEVPTSYTLIAAIDISDISRLTLKSVLTGYASYIYMSRSNLYVTFPVPEGPLGGWGRTEIYRISIDGLEVECEAKGDVAGIVPDQFSMDEYNGYFRVATTTILYDYNSGVMREENNIYVLDMRSLKVVGEIEGLAPGEQIYAARFMGDRCYLVTFKKVDPLFTIDLSDPTSPRVLGALKIPGYSDYLHPYGEDYLLGIGKEAAAAEEGDFAWQQGLKISLFDISSIEDPKEVAKMVIGDRGTDSPALFDHHALLFDGRSLLVIPILEARIFEEDYPDGIPPWAYGRPVFQGAYVFRVSPEDGIILRGRIGHMGNGGVDPLYEVKRALYIEETLYTISDGKIKANSLTDLSEISEVSLE